MLDLKVHYSCEMRSCFQLDSVQLGRKPAAVSLVNKPKVASFPDSGCGSSPLHHISRHRRQLERQNGASSSGRLLPGDAGRRSRSFRRPPSGRRSSPRRCSGSGGLTGRLVSLSSLNISPGLSLGLHPCVPGLAAYARSKEHDGTLCINEGLELIMVREIRANNKICNIIISCCLLMKEEGPNFCSSLSSSLWSYPVLNVSFSGQAFVQDLLAKKVDEGVEGL